MKATMHTLQLAETQGGGPKRSPPPTNMLPHPFAEGETRKATTVAIHDGGFYYPFQVTAMDV